MAEIRDMMATFQLYQPMELGGALDLLRRFGSDAWILSGGMDSGAVTCVAAPFSPIRTLAVLLSASQSTWTTLLSPLQR